MNVLHEAESMVDVLLGKKDVIIVINLLITPEDVKMPRPRDIKSNLMNRAMAKAPHRLGNCQ